MSSTSHIVASLPSFHLFFRCHLFSSTSPFSPSALRDRACPTIRPNHWTWYSGDSSISSLFPSPSSFITIASRPSAFLPPPSPLSSYSATAPPQHLKRQRRPSDSGPHFRPLPPPLSIQTQLYFLVSLAFHRPQDLHLFDLPILLRPRPLSTYPFYTALTPTPGRTWPPPIRNTRLHNNRPQTQRKASVRRLVHRPSSRLPVTLSLPPASPLRSPVLPSPSDVVS